MLPPTLFEIINGIRGQRLLSEKLVVIKKKGSLFRLSTKRTKDYGLPSSEFVWLEPDRNPAKRRNRSSTHRIATQGHTKPETTWVYVPVGEVYPVGRFTGKLAATK